MNKNTSNTTSNVRVKAGVRSILSDSRNNQSETEQELIKENDLAILENQQSGNPFKARDDPYENMYYVNEGGSKLNSKLSSSSLNHSIRSKKDKLKPSFPEIVAKDVSSKRSHDGNSSTIRRNKAGSKKLSMKSSNKSIDSQSSRKLQNSSFQNKSKQITSFITGPNKIFNRNLAHSSNDPKHTIMTAYEPVHRNGLEVDASNREMVNLNCSIVLDTME
jgi:hypothetical protein